jgi:hypothetical protein
MNHGWAQIGTDESCDANLQRSKKNGSGSIHTDPPPIFASKTHPRATFATFATRFWASRPKNGRDNADSHLTTSTAPMPTMPTKFSPPPRGPVVMPSGRGVTENSTPRSPRPAVQFPAFVFHCFPKRTAIPKRISRRAAEAQRNNLCVFAPLVRQ